MNLYNFKIKECNLNLLDYILSDCAEKVMQKLTGMMVFKTHSRGCQISKIIFKQYMSLKFSRFSVRLEYSFLVLIEDWVMHY